MVNRGAMPTRTRAELERRKRVRIRMRPTLVYSAQCCEGQTYQVVKDRLTLCYFRLDEGQFFAVGLMDGEHTLGDIQKAYEERFRPERLSLEELEALAAQLLEAGLAQSDSPQAGKVLAERARKQKHRALWATVLNFLAIRIPLFHPDAFLDRVAPRMRFLFSRGGVLLGLLLMLAASGLIATRWDDFLSRLPAYRDYFTVRTLVYLWLAVGLARVLHELGHGLCCKLQGGEVHEAGVLLLVFFPTLYCNTSDSWSLPGKWRRMAVAAAGIYVDLLVGAVATFVWWSSVPGALLHDLSFGLIIACGIGTVAFNANPLLRFDGYYILSDWLEMPNLAEESSRHLRTITLRFLGVGVPHASVTSRRRPVLFAAYALASFLYRVFVVSAIIYFLFTFLKPYRLGAISVVLGVTALLVMVGRPVWLLAQTLHACRRSEMNVARLWLIPGSVLTAGALFFIVPLSLSVQGRALIEIDPNHMQRVVVPDAGGFLEEVRVQDGQAVRAGDVLAVLSNSKLEVRLRVNEVDQALRLQQRRDRLAQMSEDQGDRAVAGLQQVEFELKSLAQEQDALRSQRERLTLRAPRDGIVLGLVGRETGGKWLERGTELCRIGDPAALRAVLLIEPADHRLVRAGSSAWLRAHGLGASRWQGRVIEVAQIDARHVPGQLSSRAGGDVATEQDREGVDHPRAPHYLASIRLEPERVTLPPGVLGRVKIEAIPRTAWWRLRRYLGKTFNWGL
jgi:putative peptide zinc metalloprotease protein